jgi:acyl-CoA reductase-like NAD-dependent aldehyde dehydrogenase
MSNGTHANGTNGTVDSSKPVPLWIAGEEVQGESTFDVYSPATSEKLWSASGVTPKLALQAVEKAQEALELWRKAKPAQIRTILLKAADIFESRKEELAGYMQKETGALDAFAGFNTMTTIENLRDVAGRPANILGAIPGTGSSGQGAFVFKEVCYHGLLVGELD